MLNRICPPGENLFVIFTEGRSQAARSGRQMSRKLRGKQVKNELERYGGEVLRSEIMQKAFEQRHHIYSTVGEHTFRVARASVKIGHALQKLHVPVDMPSVVVGSLCHDLGMIGRSEKYSSNKECYRNHPADSVKIAKELVGDLPEKTEEIIQRHMWPMRQSRIPNSVEGFIVSAADKYSSVVDFIKGSTKRRIRRNRGKTYGK